MRDYINWFDFYHSGKENWLFSSHSEWILDVLSSAEDHFAIFTIITLWFESVRLSVLYILLYYLCIFWAICALSLNEKFHLKIANSTLKTDSKWIRLHYGVRVYYVWVCVCVCDVRLCLRTGTTRVTFCKVGSQHWHAVISTTTKIPIQKEVITNCVEYK